MRVLVIALVLVISPGAASARASDGGTRPSLRIVSERPLVVAGRGFVAHEPVRLLLSGRTPASSAVRASAMGRFRVRLPRSTSVASQCGGVVVQAVGSFGSRAMADQPGLDCAAID